MLETKVAEVNSEFLEEIQKVVEYATKCHRMQFRKGVPLPYIVHPFSVLTQLADWGIVDLNVWKAALCHDILEDTDVQFWDLVDEIGRPAATIVKELTFVPLDNGVEKHYQKQAYLNSFSSKSIRALVIKLSDRFCNTTDFISSNPSYAPKYWKKAERLLEQLQLRSGEIKEEFGEGVFARLRYSQTCISQCL